MYHFPLDNLANPFKNPSLLQFALNASNNNTSPSPWSTNFGQDNANKNGIASTNGWPATNGFATQFPSYTQTNGNGFATNQNQNMFNTNGFMTNNNQMNEKMGNATFGFGQASTFSNPFVVSSCNLINLWVYMIDCTENQLSTP